jgi:uncharacterized membrane protein
MWDGFFHLATWVVTVIGVWMLWNTARFGGRAISATTFAGELVFGWGAFNLIEGIIDHHILQLHHVGDVPVHLPMYDWIFLSVGGGGLLLLGWLFMSSGGRWATTPR